jgi:hypothetical protein
VTNDQTNSSNSQEDVTYSIEQLDFGFYEHLFCGQLGTSSTFLIYIAAAEAAAAQQRKIAMFNSKVRVFYY